MSCLIAIIDDDLEDVMLIHDAILSFDSSIKFAPFGSSVEAVNFLTSDISEVPHLIILDFNMPVLDGLDCLQIIKSNNKFEGTIVFATSTNMSNGLADEFLRQGASFAFEKPHDITGYEFMAQQALDALRLTHCH